MYLYSATTCTLAEALSNVNFTTKETYTNANKEAKYRQLANSHIFVPVAIETAGTWNNQAVELVQELGRRMTAVTEDTRETTTCSSGCRWLSNGEMRSPSVLPQHFHHRVNAVVVLLA